MEKEEDEGPIFGTVSEESLHPALREYFARPDVRSVCYDEAQRRFAMVTQDGATLHCGGIHRFIKHKHFPRGMKPITRRTYSTHKKGSSRQIGTAVDNAVMVCVQADGARPKRINKYAKTLFDFLDTTQYTLQASQVPVYLPGVDRITTADLITLTPDMKSLAVFEIKTGFPVNRQGVYMKEPLQNVRATATNAWQLQVAYTALALQNAGLPVTEWHVLSIYHEKKPTEKTGRMHCVQIGPPPWIYEYEDHARFLISGKLQKPEKKPSAQELLEKMLKKKKRKSAKSSAKGSAKKKRKK